MKPKNFWNSGIRWQAPDLPTSAPPEAETPEAPDLSFIPADYIVDGKPDLSKFSAHYQEIVAADAQRREALADVPEDGNYEFALPADLDFGDIPLPDGFAVELDINNEAMKPLFTELSGLLKDLGAPKGAAGQAASLIAKYEAIKESQRFTAWAEDMKSLGTDAQARARAETVQRKLETMLPADQAKALFSGPRISAAGIKALEKIIAPRSLSTPPPAPQGQSLEGMTPYERLRAINAAQMKT